MRSLSSSIVSAKSQRYSHSIARGPFAFAAANDLIIAPKFTRLKEKYKQFRNQDEYIALNEVKK